MTDGVRGVGVDIVDLGAFAASLAEPGTRFTGAFSGTEKRQCRERAEARGAGPGADGSSSSDQSTHLARHLAARWAVKEAVVKAWSAALYGSPPPIAPDLLRWSEIETVCDAWGRIAHDVLVLSRPEIGEL
ncbi:MAG: 4'-phosphopantetheinyl transferase superfamily protein, partial [Dietzia sp.]